jgi:hypothetical protein
MKNKKIKKYQKSIHQHVEHFMRHRFAVSLVLMLMGLSIVVFDPHARNFLRTAYMQGWGCMGTYIRDEHPQHLDPMVTLARIPTTSSR